MKQMTTLILICLISGLLLLLIFGVVFRLARAVRGTKAMARVEDMRIEPTPDHGELYIVRFQLQDASRELRCPESLYRKLRPGDTGILTCRGCHPPVFGQKGRPRSRPCPRRNPIGDDAADGARESFPPAA